MRVRCGAIREVFSRGYKIAVSKDKKIMCGVTRGGARRFRGVYFGKIFPEVIKRAISKDSERHIQEKSL